MKSSLLRVGLPCLPVLVVLILVELGRRGTGELPIPFLLLLVAVGFAGYSGGRIAGGMAGGLAAAYVLFSHWQGFGPATLTGNLAYTLGGMCVYSLAGFFLGRLRDERDAYYANLLDTQRKEQEEPLILASQLVGLGYYIWDTIDRKPIVVSDQHIQNYGVSREEFLNKVSYAGGAFLLVHPDDREKVDFWCRNLEAGETVEMEYRVLGSAGEKWIRAIVRPIRDDTGRIVKEVCASQDITALKATETRLVDAQKMESVGKLTGGVAHDFNNMLAVILGNLELLREGLDDENQRELVDAATAAAQRSAGLTRSMLAFARKAPLQPVELDLNTVVLQANNWMRRALPESIEVETSLLAGLWPVRLDATSLESALLNLLLNARDAMDGQGRLTIETANVRFDTAYVDSRHVEVEPGRYVMLAVSDTGTGIDPENLKRIFEPFFSTKPTGAGSGMGLSMVEGFVSQSQGTVQVYTEVGVGTTVKLYFPATTPETPGAEPALPDKAITGTNSQGRILLVEDDDAVRAVLQTALGNAGYHVTPAASGDAALAVFEADPSFDIVVTDIVMPGQLQGTHLAKALRGTNPDLPFVFLSGYASEATVHGNGLTPDDIRLMKPVPKADLLKAIASLLAKPRAG